MRSPRVTFGQRYPSTTTQTQYGGAQDALMAHQRSFETLGYSGTLYQLKETGHRNLLWWGGQLGKNKSDKKYKGPTISDLGVLLRSVKEAYLKKTQRRVGPDRTKAESCLSDSALAHILIDITSSSWMPRMWVGNLTNGVWLELYQNHRIRDLDVDILLELIACTFRPTDSSVRPY
ncbi:hypothetical protein PC119_g21071 [Phytophthora cactorum]|nr:hypothetical protein PC119_g21071 [Phytophthora cactorum]KAG3155093.1 hypothetical protein PC128_g22147 [Phytophthora cactorum]